MLHSLVDSATLPILNAPHFSEIIKAKFANMNNFRKFCKTIIQLLPDRLTSR